MTSSRRCATSSSAASFAVRRLEHEGEFPNIRGSFCWGPHNTDHSIYWGLYGGPLFMETTICKMYLQADCHATVIIGVPHLLFHFSCAARDAEC